MMLRPAMLTLLMVPAALLPAMADELEVGPGKTYATIESALSKAKPGDTIRVHPRPGNAP